MKSLKVVVLSLMVLAIFSSASAQTEIGFKGIGPRLGFVLPEDPIESTFGFGAQVDIGKIGPMRLFAIAEFWSKSYDAWSGYEVNAEWSWSQFVIGPMAKYYFNASGSIKPYTGGGVALSIGKWSWEHTDPVVGYLEQSDSDTDIGFFFAAGFDFQLSPDMVGFVEGKYHMDGADYLAIFAGFTYMLK